MLRVKVADARTLPALAGSMDMRKSIIDKHIEHVAPLKLLLASSEKGMAANPGACY
jgi:hypothetical protein